METLEKSRVCRLCGKHSGISIDIFDKHENHFKKINAILPILVHEMDLLPKQMCHRCSYKLEEFHKFYIECLKTDTGLKNQLSWMRKDTSNPKETIGVPMVQIENVKIKSEPHQIDPLLESVGLVQFPMSGVESDLSDCLLYTSFANTSRCQCFCDKTNPTGKTISKDCTHLHLQKRQGFTIRLNRTSESQESDILWKKQKNLFGSSKELKALNQTNAPDFKDSSLKKSGTLARELRPRKRSVDYVGTKRKNPSSDFTEGGPQSTEADLSISNDLRIKNEPLETEALRILRPRKKLGSKRKKKRSKSADGCRKRSKSKSRSNSVAQDILDLKIKREIVENIENEGMERLNLRLKEELEDSSLCSKELFKKSKEKYRDLRVVINNSGEFAERIGNKDGLKKGHNFFDNELKGREDFKRNKDRLKKSEKDTLKAGKLSMKRSSKVQFSPKNLRSQDLHLRSGKVKVMNVLSPKSFKKDFRLGGGILDKLTDNAKMKAKFLNLEVKHLCEKCNYTFANKELFRLHACYNNN